ncbi:UNVERIFIED_CONTAM: Cyclic pyranopterin monophosphate synthase, mitochondrial [Sesamum calycinum]|uniref:Cyclic pyranopterin monophosphate synthase, mitochondrial n=1 Tax=Sesamum calycinum TaxID=2727403 RepID=A0AAW2T0S5_9LAMI
MQVMFVRRVASKLKLLSRSRVYSNDSSHDVSKVIAELNQEMESVFGQPPASSPAGSLESESMARESHLVTNDVSQQESISCLTHIGSKANQMEKGDVLGVAKIAGVCGAKQTSNLIPLCHNISLSHVHLDLTLNPHDLSVEIEGQAASTGKTGVEMEALTAVTIAGLTVYDMCKAASKDIVLTDVRLEHKSGGKSGDWSRKK